MYDHVIGGMSYALSFFWLFHRPATGQLFQQQPVPFTHQSSFAHLHDPYVPLPLRAHRSLKFPYSFLVGNSLHPSKLCA